MWNVEDPDPYNELVFVNNIVVSDHLQRVDPLP